MYTAYSVEKKTTTKESCFNSSQFSSVEKQVQIKIIKIMYFASPHRNHNDIPKDILYILPQNLHIYFVFGVLLRINVYVNRSRVSKGREGRN